jgi:hypothetical protein
MNHRPTRSALASALAAALLSFACSSPIEVVSAPSSPPGALLIRHVDVVDVASGQLRPDRDVLVRGDRIPAIALGGELSDSGDAEEIDGQITELAAFGIPMAPTDFGVIEVGKRADLLLVEGNPVMEVAALSRIRDVILGGVRLERTPVPAE